MHARVSDILDDDILMLSKNSFRFAFTTKEEKEEKKMSSELVTELLNRKNQLELSLQQTEKQLYDLETAYLSNEHGATNGSILKGFEVALSQNKTHAQVAGGGGGNEGGGGTKKKTGSAAHKNTKPEERLFSLSSKTSPVQAEVAKENEAVRLATTASGRMTKSYRK